MVSSVYDIVILDCTTKAYNPDFVQGSTLGGIQLGTINLSAALHARGHRVTVINNTPEEKSFDGVFWKNKAASPVSLPSPRNTILIANNDPNLFVPYADSIAKGARPFLWVHNTLNLKRFLREERWRSYLRFRPEGVFLSHDALKNTPCYYPFGGKTIIPHFLHDDFLSAPQVSPTGKRVVFTSQPHRGLDKSVRLWISRVLPACAEASFHLYCDKQAACDVVGMREEDLKRYNVILEGRKTRKDLIAAMGGSRAMFYPGSRDETFCYAAAEALALGIPVVTQGIGSLKDRVRDGVDGFIRARDADFADALVKVLRDDALWQGLSQNAAAAQKALSKEAVLDLWEQRFRQE